MQNSNFKTNRVLIAAGIIIILPLLVFIYNFKNVSFSKKTSDWAEFSTYWAAFIGFANLFVFIYFTSLIHKYTRDRDKLLDNFEKPVIAFLKLSQLDRYTIINVGKGAALNIRVKSKLDKIQSVWELEKITYSFSSGKEKNMDWTTDCNALCALYEDILGTKYISYMEDDKLTFIDESNPRTKNVNIAKYNLSQLGAKKTEWFS